MSVRRWFGVTGIVVAVAGGTAATVRAGADTQYEAQVALQLRWSASKGAPSVPIHDPERLLDAPEVRDLVRLRLGETPPLRVKPLTNDTILVRSRGATRQQGVEATTTYAASFVDVRRRQVEGDVDAAARQVQQRIYELQRQIDAAAEPQRAGLVQAQGLFKNKLDDLHAARGRGPEVVGSAPAEPVDDGAGQAWIVAALGVALGIGAAASGRRTKSVPPADS